MSNIVFTSAHQLADAIRKREISAVEVLDAHLTQIAKHNSKLNAICTLDEARARQRAKQADEALARGESWGALHGVPVTVKDIFETAGLRTTAGYKPLKDYIPQRDATAVARLRAAGAILVGKTNPAELASDWQGINDLFPRVNNPWNLNFTPGGSSSGSAAAIAAGFSPLDIGDDVGGSIRQPAHFCGIFGLKPTDRRVPTTGHIPEVPGMPRCVRQMLAIGPLARCVEDLSLCLQIIAGPDPSQPEIPPVPLDTPTDKTLQNLRIAWTGEFPLLPVSSEIKSAIQSVAQRLAGAGTQMEQWVPAFDFVAAWQVYFTVACYNFLYAQPAMLDDARKQIPVLFREGTQGEPALRNLSNVPGTILPIALNPTLKGYFEALTERDRLIAQMDGELAQWDVWLCPVAMTPAFTHRAKGEAVEVEGRKVPYLMASGAYTAPFALTGHPVAVIPIGRTKDGLPIGMQIVGQRWREMQLLAVAKQLSAAIGDFQHPSGY
ncbi:amidase [Kamptonema formosum]|uniref:amidase n=1 Tax=Kamptonema formosum TaxID=331992 RepID=UPI00034BB27E|nr:amidase [Oscillatoria sp. PCC 10802]